MTWFKAVVKSQMLDFKDFELLCEFKRVKYLRLKFSAKGEFKISAPLNYSKRQILVFLEKNEGWMRQKMAHFQAKNSAKQGTIDFLGKRYLLEFDENSKKVRIMPRNLVINLALNLQNECEDLAFNDDFNALLRENPQDFHGKAQFKNFKNSEKLALNDENLDNAHCKKSKIKPMLDFSRQGASQNPAENFTPNLSQNSNEFLNSSQNDENLGGLFALSNFGKNGENLTANKGKLAYERNLALNSQNLILKKPKSSEISSLLKAKFSEILSENENLAGLIIASNERVLEAFLRANALKIFVYYVKKWRKHFTEDISHVSVKKMTTRWGSCNSRKGYINLNLRLIAKPLKAIEYVILHELTHLKHAHHQAPFWDAILALMPDYKSREKMLKQL